MTDGSVSGTLNSKKHNNSKATWVNIGAVVLFIASISGWFMVAGVYREKVNHLESHIIFIRERIHEVEMWQRDWPTQGELIMDRAQNTKIDDLLRRVDLLEERAIQVRILE